MAERGLPPSSGKIYPFWFVRSLQGPRIFDLKPVLLHERICNACRKLLRAEAHGESPHRL